MCKGNGRYLWCSQGRSLLASTVRGVGGAARSSAGPWSKALQCSEAACPLGCSDCLPLASSSLSLACWQCSALRFFLRSKSLWVQDSPRLNPYVWLKGGSCPQQPPNPHPFPREHLPSAWSRQTSETRGEDASKHKQRNNRWEGRSSAASQLSSGNKLWATHIRAPTSAPSQQK